MDRILYYFVFISSLVFFTTTVKAQNKLDNLNKAKLSKLALNEANKYKISHERGLALAKKYKLIMEEHRPDGSTVSLQGFNQSGKPVFYTTYNNTTAAATTSTDKIWTGGTAGLNLTGSSSFLAGKIGIWDGGAVRKTHQELVGRIVNRDNYSKADAHATHVAGTMIARGLNPTAKGMAYGAPDLQSWQFNNDVSEIAGAASNLLLSNHSYGQQTGWMLSGGNWFWLGNVKVSDKEDFNFGYYDQTAQVWDDIAFNAPYYLMVKAIGNSNNAAQPALGTPYYRFDANNRMELVSAGRTADMREDAGYDLIPDHSVAKNILSVGAVHSLANGYTKPEDVVIASFSSWGPTDDGRIKPDLVGNGVGVYSTGASHDESYFGGNGTSMASPNVTGSLVLLQEYYAKLNNGDFMKAATLKGLALHTAKESGANSGPDYVYGWGLLNTEGAAKILSNAGKKNLVRELKLEQSQTYTQSITAAGTEPLRISISWTDPAGPVMSVSAGPAVLNNRTPRLVNDLDIRVSDGSTTFYPWVLDPANPAAAATTGDNFRDNMEQIVIPNPQPGKTYTITVAHKGTLRNKQQDFSLIVSGLLGNPYNVTSLGKTSGARIENVTLGSINNNSSDCNNYADYTTFITRAEVGQVVPFSIKLGSCGADATKTVKILVDWNEDDDFEDEAEVAGTSPAIMGNGTYTGTIRVPALGRIGNTTRLRVQVLEAFNGPVLSADNSFEKGEVEDYTLLLAASSTDVGITKIINPAAPEFYATSGQSVTVSLRNYGSSAQTNIPVSLTITDAAGQVSTLTGTYMGTLEAAEEVNFVLPGTFPVRANTTYTFTAATSLTQDQNTGNDGATITLISAPANNTLVLATATRCSENTSVTLKVTSSENIFWYDAPLGGNFIGLGNNVTTTVIPTNKTYYAAINDFTGNTAELLNKEPGTFSSTKESVYFNASLPFILEQVSLDAQTPGTITIQLINPARAIINTTQLQVIPGTQTYPLHFTIPAAGDRYELAISANAGGVSLNRHDGAGTIQYPYSIANLATITGSSSGKNSLYFYNWKVRAQGNPGTRVAVSVNGTLSSSVKAVCAATNTGTLNLTNYSGNIIRWEKSVDKETWLPVTDTTEQITFTNIAVATYYRVVLQALTCAEAFSESIKIELLPAPEAKITAGTTAGCSGSCFVLTATAGTRYLWSTGDTTQSIQVQEAGNYTVTITNAGGCTATSQPYEVITNLTTWTGKINTDWFNRGNWSQKVPDATSEVVIPVRASNFPSITAGQALAKQIKVAGSLTLSGGTLSVKGNFINTGSFHHENGLLELTGADTTKLAGGPFLNLTMAGSGTIMLASDIQVNGNLTIRNGGVVTGNHTIILGSQALLSEDDSHYITGRVETTRTFSSTETTHNFANLGVKLTTAAAPGNINVIRTTGLSTDRIKNSIPRQYAIKVLSDLKTGLNATVEFAYLPHELQDLDKNKLALFQSKDNGLTWELQPNGEINQSADIYKITQKGINVSSVWTAAIHNNLPADSTALPVKVLSFTVNKKDNQVIITWETIWAKEKLGMAIEVSTDAKIFRELYYMEANGANLNFPQIYTYLDKVVNKTGIRYYRLKQVTPDGKPVYYGIQAVDLKEDLKVAFLQAYPNPNTGAFTLACQAEKPEPMELRVINTSGQVVYTAIQQLNTGANNLSIVLPAHVAPGIYLLTARYKDQTQQLKIVRQ